MNGKPQQTAADFMVIALSPILIMGLVGSLCFFLVEVFYQGPMGGMARWVLFWFVIAIVLISRIAIENTSEHAGVYGLALAATVWMVLIRTSPSFIFSMVLLAVVWFCANKLVWDCTLIDDDEDSSGHGLLQKARPEPNVNTTSKTKRKKRIVSSSPGRWVVYFSLLALPLFGIGQMLLPPDASGSRRWGIAFLVVYMASALGLLVTTSFLGLRRYLRQRYLKMPVSIALAWVKFGGGIALLIVVGALFVPRPGGKAFWSSVRKQTDYRLHQASEYASARNPHGEGEGKAGNESGAETGEKRALGDLGPHEKSQAGMPMPGSGAPAPSRGQVLPSPTVGLEQILRTALICAALALVCWWVFRARHVLWEMVCAGWVAVRDFFRRLLDLMPARKPISSTGPELPRRSVRPLADFKNPFFAEKGSLRPPEEIILYTYEALQAWTREQGTEPRPDQTAREFCEETGGRLPELVSPLRQLAFLYAHAAYGEHLPREYDLEPLKEIWRRLTWK